jgi:hypothetical protein
MLHFLIIGGGVHFTSIFDMVMLKDMLYKISNKKLMMELMQLYIKLTEAFSSRLALTWNNHNSFSLNTMLLQHVILPTPNGDESRVSYVLQIQKQMLQIS